jgi:universal stress protein E
MTIQNSPSTPPHRSLQNVLIGTSLGEESESVVRAGLALARAAGARVTLVHAAQLDTLQILQSAAGPAVVESAVQETLEERRRELERQIERHGIAASELAGAQVLSGPPHQILTAAAQSIAADLVVVGATGSGPVAAELLGSTADRVLRKADCPVLVVRGELPVPPRRVLAPVDLSPLSAAAFAGGLRLLAQIAGEAETAVRAVHVLSFLEVLALGREGGRGELAPYEEVERLAAEQLRRLVQEDRPGEGRFRIDTAVLPGEARFEILRDLEQNPADLVVLGTHGRGGFDRLMLGSVAATVARRAPCSVLLIPPLSQATQA